MSKRWMMGLAMAVAVVAVGGVGFAAFSSSAVVNGSATAATVSLLIYPYAYECYWTGNFTTYANGTVSVTGGGSSVTMTAGNLLPGTTCEGIVDVYDESSVPINLTISLSGTGLCGPSSTNGCYDVYDIYGVASETGTYAQEFPNLPVGLAFSDAWSVSIPAGWTSAPSSITFTGTYTATAGL
jgi:hypothetical protein